MTAGQLLVSISGLSGVSAGAHLLAIQGGSGTGKTVFASLFSVRIDEPQLAMVQTPKTEAREDYRPAISRLSSGDTEKAVSIFTRTAALSVLTERDEWCIRQGGADSLIVQDFGHESFTVRQSDVIEIN